MINRVTRQSSLPQRTSPNRLKRAENRLPSRVSGYSAHNDFNWGETFHMRRNIATVLFSSIFAALVVTGCGGSDSSTKSTSAKKAVFATQSRTIVSGSVTFTSNPTTSAELTKSGVSVSANKPAKVQGTSVVLPVDSGNIVVSTAIGSAHGTGSFVFSANGKKVVYDKVVVNTRTRRVTGVVGGKREPLYHLSLSNIKQSKMQAGDVTATGLSVTLTKKAASLLNKDLGTKAFKNGLKMGNVTLTVKTKKTAHKAMVKSSKSSTSTTTKSGN